MLRRDSLEVVAFQAISNSALSSETLPTELKVLNWGENDVCDGTKVFLNDESVRHFSALQKKSGRTRVAVDYNHCTVAGTQANKEFGDKPAIFAYGNPVIRKGDGLYLTRVEWTPYGEKYARNVSDISPTPLLRNGVVVGLDSVALTPNGAIDGLTFYAAPSPGRIACYSSVEAYAAGDGIDFSPEGHGIHCMCAHCMADEYATLDADDHKAEYGDVEYADTKNHKYPIDTEKHVRAAWSYINMPKNQKGYNHSEVAAIKKRIRSKFHEFGIGSSTETHSMSAPHYTSVEDIPASSGQPSNYQQLSMEIKAHIAHFRKELGLPDESSDEDVMEKVKAHFATWKTKQPNLSNSGSNEGELEKGNLPGMTSNPHATITYKAQVEEALKPLMARLEKLEAVKPLLAPSDEEVKDGIMKSAALEGKIIPLSADALKACPVTVLKDIVAQTPAKVVPMEPIVRPLSADAVKPELRAAKVKTTQSAWLKAIGQ